MRKMSSRRGFTLAEVLVTVTIVAVLAAVMVPAVINQVGKGDVPSIADDLGGIRTAITTFAADTRQFPGKLSDLGAASLAAGNDVIATPYTADAVQHYRGPYASITSGHIGPTGAIFANALTTVGHAVCMQDSVPSSGPSSGLSLVTSSQAAQIKQALDQNTSVIGGGSGVSSAGSVTYQLSGTTATNIVVAGTLRVCLTSY
jgi:prepilin-type N-terminal cleavage/methylation domain-containing protein